MAIRASSIWKSSAISSSSGLLASIPLDARIMHHFTLCTAEKIIRHIDPIRHRSIEDLKLPLQGPRVQMSFSMDLSKVPPLPKDFEPVFLETLEKIKGIAARVKDQRARQNFPGRGSSFFQAANSTTNGERSRLTTEMLVPGNRAGLVIGTRGETLKSFERMSQCKIQFDQQWTGPDNERRVIIVGLPEDVAEAKRLIQAKVDEPGMGGGRFPTVQMMVPSHRVGLVIGKGGETIRELQELSGAKIAVSPDGGNDQTTGERAINICGDDEAVRRAKAMISELVVHGTRPNIGSSSLPPHMQLGKNTTTVAIPEATVGIIIGKRAENLKNMQQASGCRIFVEPTLAEGATMRSVHLTGPPESIAYAQQLISEKVMQHQAAMSGSEYASYEGQGGVIYQAPGDFAASIAADPSAAAGQFDYAQYYAQYYQQQQAAYSQYYPGYDPSQAQAYQQPQQHDPNQQAFDYAAYAAQYSAAQQQQPPQ